MIANIFWITTIEVRWYSLNVTSLPLFITPIFCLFVVVWINRWLWCVRPRWCLEPSELVILYVVMVTSAVFAGHNMLQNLFGANWACSVGVHRSRRAGGSVFFCLHSTPPVCIVRRIGGSCF